MIRKVKGGYSIICVKEKILAYTAGIIDGEGYIGIICNRKPFGNRNFIYDVVVQVTNTSKKMIQFLYHNFGGAMPKRQQPPSHIRYNQKPVYQWRLWGTKAQIVLRHLYPYLVVKKLQAKLVIEFQKKKNSRDNKNGKYTRLTVNDILQREQIYEEMRKLNKRGII